MNHSLPNQSRHHYALFSGIASLVVVTILIAIKSYAYLSNGSVSVLASLIDSIVDAGVSLIMVMAIRISLKPADSEHRHGHGKIEGLAALFQSAFIAAAAFFLFFESIRHFAAPEANEKSDAVILIMAVSAGLSLALTAVQTWSLKHAPSLAVEADRAHYSADIIINIGVIAVIFAIHYGAPVWIDPAFGMAVVIYLAFTVRHIAGQGMDMLLDRELPDKSRELITKKVLSHQYVLGMHDLRTHKSGMRAFISFDMELDPSLLLYNAHEIVREVEHDLLIDFPNAEILIHVDPYGDTHDTRHHVAGVHDS